MFISSFLVNFLDFFPDDYNLSQPYNIIV